MECINCGHSFNGKFCPECGQKVHTKRYSLLKVAHETIESLDVNKGFFRTIYLLFTQPGFAVRQYLEGKALLYNPFKLLIITGAIATLISFRFSLFLGGSDENSSEAGIFAFLNLKNQAEYVFLSTKYFSFTNFVGIPLFALITWMVYLKERMNFSEHLVLNVYIGSGQLILTFLFAPIIVLSNYSEWSVLSYGFLNIIYNLWLLISFFRGHLAMVILKGLLTLLLGYVLAYFTNYFLFQIIPSSIFELFEAL